MPRVNFNFIDVLEEGIMPVYSLVDAQYFIDAIVYKTETVNTITLPQLSAAGCQF